MKASAQQQMSQKGQHLSGISSSSALLATLASRLDKTLTMATMNHQTQQTSIERTQAEAAFFIAGRSHALRLEPTLPIDCRDSKNMKASFTGSYWNSGNRIRRFRPLVANG